MSMICLTIDDRDLRHLKINRKARITDVCPELCHFLFCQDVHAMLSTSECFSSELMETLRDPNIEQTKRVGQGN